MSDAEPFDFTLDLNRKSPRSAAADSAPPERIGRYRIRNVLGKGSFGVVYLTYDEQLDRLVAIKVPHAALIEQPEVAHIYLEEARAVANLDHPNIVPVYDVGNTDECPCYIVSKYIEGIDLTTKLKKSSLDFQQAAELVATVAAALHFAHTQGFVHRDVKPGNILIDSDGKPYIVDFGLALSEKNIGKGETYVGTPAYMSPEQARGEGHRVDGRSDIFSLGVMFYELLAGKRPFRGKTLTEISDQVISVDTKPLRQLNDAIPRELERICLKSMSKRASERYTTARDMADDLWQYLAENPEGAGLPSSSSRIMSGIAFNSTVQDGSVTNTASANPSTAGPSMASATMDLGSISQPIKIVPKGLRSFDEHDAEFFQELLPGPRDRRGLPDSLRFWKTRIEETDPSKTFTAGLICGPSGCGKSSFVKAGLLPRLSEDVIPVYIEATANDTESRLLNGVRRACPGLAPDLDLKASLALLRQDNDIARNRKVVLILDQFEQWLHANRDQEDTELARALRQCDGSGVQCILMVRDDFWMAVIRFMRELEVRLLEGENTAALDLFEPDHARKVLAAFGRAFARLPESLKDTSREQTDFLKQAVSGLTEEGKVICVRLALFAEMMKNKPWTTASLKQVGGTQGVGVTFLEETFGAAAATPQHRYHQKAARAILQALLPESGTNIKGHMRSYNELLELSGYARRPQDFEDLIKILDNEIRLITPTDPAGAEPDSVSAAAGEAGQRYYQLTHDYLVHSLRNWLTRKQKETRRGRAQINLAERALLWSAKQDPQQLPSIPAWLNIRLSTSKSEWSDTERAMMRTAGRRHSARFSVAAMIVLCGILVGAYFWHLASEQNMQMRADAEVKRLADAQTSEVPRIVQDLQPIRQWVNPKLVSLSEQSDAKSKAKLHAALGLLPDDKSQIDFLVDRLRYSTPKELLTIRTFLEPLKDEVVVTLWQKHDADAANDNEQFRFASALAGLDATSERWNDNALADRLASKMVNEPLSEVAVWIEALRPIQPFMVQPLCEIFRDKSRPETARLVAANVLAYYAGNDVDLLSALILDANAEQFAVLLPKLKLNREHAVGILEGELAKTAEGKWPEVKKTDWKEPDERLVASLEAADGMLTPDFAMAQTLPLEAFDRVAYELTLFGYRPERFRPYETSDGVRVAAIWKRDGLRCRWSSDKTPEEISNENVALRKEGFHPLDVAFYDTSTGAKQPVRRYAALWVHDCHEFEDSVMFVGVPESKHYDAYAPLLARFVPLTDIKDEAAGREALYSSVRWKLKKYPWVVDNEADLETAKNLSANAWYQADVRIVKSADKEIKFAGLWWPSVEYETRTSHGLSPTEHRREFQRFCEAGFRPQSITVSSVSGASRLTTACVWRRPTVTDDDADGLAKRQASAALAIAGLGKPETLWPLLNLKPDPTLRSHLTNRLQAFGIPVDEIMDRLQSLQTESGESFNSQRRALLIALSEFDVNQFSLARQTSLLTEIESLYRGDPDPGVHSAAEVVLRNWQRIDLARQIDEELQQADAELHGKRPPNRGWYVTTAGQTMAVVPSFEQWKMGSPGHRPSRIQHMELLHPKLLKRRIAVSTKEITIQQYRQLLPEHDYAHEYTATEDCPINMVTWFDAAKYCRLLSEREKIPRDQMCYPPIDEIMPGMKMPADYLQRTGYRLLTEAEWEFMCRAGTTSSRFFGNSPELLDRYAFTAQNSGYVASPVGSLLPNDFGLFDMLGNAYEWCQDPEGDAYLPPPFGTEPLNDPEDLGEITEDSVRTLRGGSFLYQPSDARSAHRYRYTATASTPFLSFRIARTVTD